MTEHEFAAFYEATRPRLVAYLARASGSLTLAEDLMQEAYVRLLSSAPTTIAGEEATRYLYRIASNLLVDHWRKMKMRLIDTDPSQYGGPGPAIEAALDVRVAFERMPERERALLWLAYVEGFDHKQISASLNLKVTSVKVLLLRARRKLLARVAEKESR